jgi:hypothetical protein
MKAGSELEGTLWRNSGIMDFFKFIPYESKNQYKFLHNAVAWQLHVPLFK